MKRLFLLLSVLLTFVALAQGQEDDRHWIPNPYQYPNNMTMIGVVSFNEVEQYSESLEIGAFCGDECRGSSIAQYEESFDRYFIFMMVYGEGNDNISFRCYDHKRNLELEMIQDASITFQTNAMIGGIVDPFIFAFTSYQHTISLNALPEVGGTVSGDGIYNRYDTCFVNVNVNPGYQLDALIENGDTLTKQPYYSFIVLSDRQIEAHFSEAPIYYQITTEAKPEAGGSISGGGQYIENSSCTLTVTTNTGYDYLGLYENDQLLTNDHTYTFVAEADRHFVAKFELQINYYQISAEMSPEAAGIISGLGIYQENESCHLEITPNTGYDFVALTENGDVVSEEPSYSFVVESNRHFVAEFVKQINYYEITAVVTPNDAGTISGLGMYQENTTCHLEITPNVGYEFVALKENGEIISEESDYSFIVDSDRDFVAEFSIRNIDVTLEASPVEGGSVSGGGAYPYGSTVYAIAVPNTDYIFVNWTDEDGTIISTNPQYVFEAKEPISMIANFVYVDALMENSDKYFTIYPNPASDYITIENCDYNVDVVIYDLTGKKMLEAYLDSDESKINIGGIPSGLYIVSVGETVMKLVIR